jgi:hypothetical protein
MREDARAELLDVEEIGSRAALQPLPPVKVGTVEEALRTGLRAAS